MKIPGVEYRPLCELCNMPQELYIAETKNFKLYAYNKPFNNGHVVLVHRRHVGFEELSIEEVYEALDMIRRVEDILDRLYRPNGFNIGIVYKPHVAFHIVPRWNGDVSFMKVFFDVKPIPETPIQYANRIRSMLSLGAV